MSGTSRAPQQRKLLNWACLSALLFPSAALAEWLPNGNPVVPTSYGERPTVSSDGAGGAFFSWHQWDLMAWIVRFSSNGEVAPGWPAGGRVARTTSQGLRGDDDPVLVPDGEGGAFVVLGVLEAPGPGSNVEPRAIYVQRITATGSFAPGWPETGVRATSTWMPGRRDRWYRPRAVSDAHGGVIIAWQVYDVFTGPISGPLYAQRIGPDGSRAWGESARLICDAAGFRSHPDVVADGRGGAFVCWCERRSWAREGHLYGQHVSATGEPL